MAILELKINGIEAYLDNTSGAETGCLSLKSNQSDGEVDFGKGVKTTGGVFLKGRDVKDDKDVVTNYKVHMTNVDFKKRMYAPTEIIAVLNIFPVTPTSTTDNQNNNGPAPKPTWYPLTKDYIVSLFQNKKVTLQSEDGKVVGDDFYVEDILPRYKKDSMFVMLRIYSPDHQMALTQGSAVFVGKRFGTDVLANEVKKYIKPWCVDTIEVLKRKIAVKEAAIATLDSDTKDKSDEAYIKQKDKLEEEKSELEKDLNEKESNMESISYSGKMKVLAYDKKSTKKPKDQWKNKETPEYNEEPIEHIFPYLVQYNEPLYDMLKRTANRWGEFLFYEDGMLQLGYDDTQKPDKEVTGWYSLNYCDLKSHLRTDNTDNTYDPEAAYDENIVKSPIQKNSSKIKNLPGCSMDDGLDTWLMKTIASFLGNTKNIPTWIGNQTFDNLYNLAVQKRNNGYVDNDISEKYFQNENKDEFAQHYGNTEFDKKTAFGYSQFTEINSKFKEDYYRTILRKEQAAIQKGVCLNFDTTYPDLKLGQIIKVNGEEYLVINVECETKNSVIISNDLWVVPDDTPVLHFKVTAVGRYKDVSGVDADNNFYPTMLPSGHIRTSGAQLAKVWDADDPLNQNRVRIHFAWQGVDTEREENPTPKDIAEACASPWLVYATSAASKSNGIFGKHYQGDEVIVNFANGNVENPYIVGGLAMKGNKVPGSLAERDIVLTSPGGHTLRMDDGSGAGLTAFLAGVLTPGYDLLTTFFPGTSGYDLMSEKLKADPKKSKQFEGGFQLTDKYGIYTISGSTDGRNVSVKSPWGDVAISAFTGISISAPNGDIEIKGKNVKIEAGNNLELVSGTNIGNSWRPHKDTIPGGIAQVGTDIMAAVTKKLADKLATFIDLSILRQMFEIVVRPIEGATVVKSNRFLKLEAGEDECIYPETGYKNVNKVKKISEGEIRQGLALAKGVAGLVYKTKSIAADIDADFRSRYNDCVKKHNSFKRAVDNARRYANGYTANNDVKVCKTLEENTAKFWEAGAYAPLVENDLGFSDNYKAEELGNVDGDAVTAYWGGRDLTGWDDEQKKRPIIDARVMHRAKILAAANNLRKSICKLMVVEALDDLTIKRKIGWNYGHDLPKKYKDAIKAAFTEGNLGDYFLYRNLTEDDKKLTTEKTKTNTSTSRKTLRRKAAAILLKELGFKDDWNNVAVPTKTNIANANSNAWTSFVNGLKAFPPLEAKQLALNKAFFNPFKEAKEGLNPIQVTKEYDVWKNSKKGSVLFTHEGDTFILGAAAHPITHPNAADHLEADDNNNKDVKDALDKIKDALKEL